MRIFNTFFNLGKSDWRSLSIGEGVAIISSNVPECEVRLADRVDADVDYPVVPFFEFDCYIGKEILRMFEYRLPGVDEGCVGVYFDCGECGFSVIEDDGCLSFVGGVVQMDDKIVLVEIDAG